jgi:hypothetical protein|tara:strand:+ start:4297 stop:4728 length:432 start_codon:yes stop_codon:yes gene_type:complete
MAVKRSISEIVNKLTDIKSKEEKIAWLRENDSIPLRTVLKYTYDDKVVFLIPNTPPPWKYNEYEDEAKSLLYTEARRLKIFVEGGGYPTLKQIKREQLFISLLEDVDNDDADLLANHMLTKKSIKGLTKKTLMEAFPQLIEEE